MTEPPIQELPALTAPPATPHAGLRQPAFWLAVGALVAVLLLGWFGSQRDSVMREEFDRRLAAGESAQRDAQANAKQNREALDALQAKVGALEAQLAEMRSQQLALEAMYQELSRVRDDRLLAEIEQEVALAAQQLTLAGNVEAALIALTGAEARLARSAQPQFQPLRKLLARDLERLKALPGADVPGMTRKLDMVLEALPSLPLAYEQRPAAGKTTRKAAKGQPAPLGGEASGAVSPEPTLAGMLRAWGADLWQELRQLVRIERIDTRGTGDAGLLAPREVFFLRENLRLRLLAARIALLARDGHSFQSDLKQAGDWLERYFDTRAPAVREVQETLKGLARVDVMRAPAELDETLAAVRNFRFARERGATK